MSLQDRIKKMEIIVSAKDASGPFGFRDHVHMYTGMQAFLASGDEWMVMPGGGKAYGRNMIEAWVDEFDRDRGWWADRGVVY